MPEERSKKRIPIRIPAKIYLAHEPEKVYDANILDISEGGAFVHCTAPIRMDDEIRIEIEFQKGDIFKETVELSPAKAVSSKVRWARGSSSAGFGIEFINLTEEKKAFLKKVVAEFEKIISPK